MTRYLPIASLLTGLLLIFAPARAQEGLNTPRFRVYNIDGEGEPFMSGELEGIDITAPRPTASQLRQGRKRLARFTRLRWNVHKVYPYAVKVATVLDEVEQEIQALPDDGSRKDYVKDTEQSLFGEYEDDVRQMTRSQGKVLVKLVYRETGQSGFDLIKDNKNGASAVFWQSIGLIFGINLKTTFDAEIEDEDEMIEYIVRELENGGYNIAYRQYNFHLD
ncbi:MAG: hypothetical protein OHK0039_44470 [Bacteroidia bacterium]